MNISKIKQCLELVEQYLPYETWVTFRDSIMYLPVDLTDPQELQNKLLDLGAQYSTGEECYYVYD